MKFWRNVRRAFREAPDIPIWPSVVPMVVATVASEWIRVKFHLPRFPLVPTMSSGAVFIALLVVRGRPGFRAMSVSRIVLWSAAVWVAVSMVEWLYPWT